MSNVFDPNELVAVTEKRLELLKIGMTKAVAENLGTTAADNLQVIARFDEEMRATLYTFTTSILADKLVDDTYTAYAKSEHYSSWWQMFKDTSKFWKRLPKKFRDRHPVRQYTQSHKVEVKFVRYATYPKANIAIQNPNLGLKVFTRDVAHQK